MVQSLCGLGLVGRGPLQGELGWGRFAVGSVGAVGVVVEPPVLDDHAGLEEAVEAPRVEKLVAEPSVEGFDPGVLRR